MISITPKFSYQNSINQPNYNRAQISTTPQFCALKQDTFQLQNKSNPSFGAGIPRETIIKYSDGVVKRLKCVSDHDSVVKLADDLRENLLRISATPVNSTEKIGNDFHTFRHELKNQLLALKSMITDPVYRDMAHEIMPQYAEIKTDAEYFAFKKNMIHEMVDYTKSFTNRWIRHEKWSQNPDQIVPVNSVIKELKEAYKETKHRGITVKGLELLRGMKVKNPAQLYDIYSQILLNAVKYGEGKPIKIVIKESIKDGKKSYYAFFINPKTKALPEAEIADFIKGKGARGSNGKDAKIEGTGFGISEVVRYLKETGHEKNIETLFEKRTQGVCVRVPLIGLQ